MSPDEKVEGKVEERVDEVAVKEETPEAAKPKGPTVEEIKADLAKKKRELEEKAAEYKVFILKGFEVITLKGEKVNIPPLNGKSEKKAVLALIDFMVTDEGIMALFQGGRAKTKVSDFLKLLSGSSSEKAFDCLVDMSAALSGKTEEWVNKHLLLTDMIQVVKPFFVIEIGALKGKFSLKNLPQKEK